MQRAKLLVVGVSSVSAPPLAITGTNQLRAEPRFSYLQNRQAKKQKTIRTRVETQSTALNKQ